MNKYCYLSGRVNMKVNIISNTRYVSKPVLSKIAFQEDLAWVHAACLLLLLSQTSSPIMIVANTLCKWELQIGYHLSSFAVTNPPISLLNTLDRIHNFRLWSTPSTTSLALGWTPRLTTIRTLALYIHPSKSGQPRFLTATQPLMPASMVTSI